MTHRRRRHEDRAVSEAQRNRPRILLELVVRVGDRTSIGDLNLVEVSLWDARNAEAELATVAGHVTFIQLAVADDLPGAIADHHSSACLHVAVAAVSGAGTSAEIEYRVAARVGQGHRSGDDVLLDGRGRRGLR